MGGVDNRSPRVILASGSPRRREWLTKTGLAFELKPTEIDESLLVGESPCDVVRRVALAKGRAAQVGNDRAIIIAADTIVVHAGEVLGKPRDEREAEATLRRLRGRWHEVLTGLVVLRGAEQCLEVVKSRVLMREYADKEIAEYVASGDPLDKAGSYAVQNARFHPVAQIKGCYLNVVGLPLCALYRGVALLGMEMPATLPNECVDGMGECGYSPFRGCNSEVGAYVVHLPNLPPRRIPRLCSRHRERMSDLEWRPCLWFAISHLYR